MLYTISYDLRKRRDYQTLYDELARLGARRCLRSFWLVRRTNTDAEGLREHLKRFIDADDGVFVAALGNNQWASFNVEATPHDL